MLGVAELTIRKLKEPAFFIMLLAAALIGLCISDFGNLYDQFKGDVVAQLINVQQGYPILVGSFFAFAVTCLIAIFAGATEIPSDIETRFIMLIISKPIRKSEYIVGKFLGILGLCFIFFISIEVAILIGHLLKTGEFYSFGFVLRQFNLIWGILPLVGCAVMVSCFLADFSAMIVTSIYLLFALSISVVPLLVEMLPDGIGINSYLFIFYYFFPNFVYYFQSFSIVGVLGIALAMYSLTSTSLFLVIAFLQFNSRDLVEKI